MFSFNPNYGFGYPAADPYSYGYARQPYAYEPRRSRYQAQRQAQQQRAQRERARAYVPHEYGFADSSDEDDPVRFDYGLSHNPFGFGRRPSPKPASPPKHTQIPVRSPDEPQSASPPKRPKSEAPTSSAPLEVQEAAASKIQQAYRLHRSIKTINSIESKFEEAQNSFTFPDSVDFQDPADREKIISVSSATIPISILSLSSTKPKLAYNSHNASLLAYIESLNRLLTSLDAVESWGDSSIRQHRKQVVRKIEKELEAVEGIDSDEETRDDQDMFKGWKGLWRRFLATQHNNDSGIDMTLDSKQDTTTAEDDSIMENVLVADSKQDTTAEDDSTMEDVFVVDSKLDTRTAEELQDDSITTDVHVPHNVIA